MREETFFNLIVIFILLTCRILQMANHCCDIMHDVGVTSLPDVCRHVTCDVQYLVVAVVDAYYYVKPK